MSLLKFWREMEKFNRECDVVQELAFAQFESEFLSGEEKEVVAQETATELLKMHDKYIGWLHPEIAKAKLLNVFLLGVVGALGVKTIFKNS